jgi:putative copper export protein
VRALAATGPQLAGALDALRLSLHVLAATVWVGGQITVAGLLPTVRGLGEHATKAIAQAFGRIQWPAYVVLLITGVWNVLAVHVRHASGPWKAVLVAKIVVVLAAGLAAYLHQHSKTKAGLAIGGAVTSLTSLGALVLGVVLAG